MVCLFIICTPGRGRSLPFCCFQTYLKGGFLEELKARRLMLLCPTLGSSFAPSASFFFHISFFWGLDRALAGLLGQVKPPTATEAEIANSGLEIIKGQDVPAALEQGKVMANTAVRFRIVTISRFPYLSMFFFLSIIGDRLRRFCLGLSVRNDC